MQAVSRHGRLTPRLTAIGLAAAIALLLSACGQTATSTAGPVKLTVSSPTDGSRVETATATISGVVTPHSSQILVLGHGVSASADGSFSTTVTLSPGTNLVDVIASAPHSRPAMVSLRVVRYVMISVPNVLGKSPSAAAAALRNAGLKPELHGDSNPLAFLLPLPEQVCSQYPGAGTQVAPDTAVALHLGKLCT